MPSLRTQISSFFAPAALSLGLFAGAASSANATTVHPQEPDIFEQSTKVEAQYNAERAFADTIITKLKVDADGNTVFRISAPAPEKMSIHTPFHGQQVRRGSDVYVVEGELGEKIITFKALDTDRYMAEQVRPDPNGFFQIGDIINLGEAAAAGKVKKSENARYFVVKDPVTGAVNEMNVGIGFPQLAEGDNVQGTWAIIKDAAGNETRLDITDYIMDAERMAALNVKVAGDGVMPEDYLVIAITPDSGEILDVINRALEQPRARIRFIAESRLGRRVNTPEVAFGDSWRQDIVLGQEIVEEGAQYDLPLSKTFGALVSTDFAQQLDHKIGECKFLHIDPAKLEEYDYYMANLDGFSGPFPRDHEAIIATLQGSMEPIAIGQRYMWGVNKENPDMIKWSMTGSFQNVALTMTPEELRQLSQGCVKDNKGIVWSPYAEEQLAFLSPDQLYYNLFNGGTLHHGIGGFFFGGPGGGGGIIIVSEDPSKVPLPASVFLLLGGLAGFGGFGGLRYVSRNNNRTAKADAPRAALA